MSDHVIETRGLTKHYGEVAAVDDLDLQVDRGEVFGFLGPNGAGKTTTMRTLLDQVRATRGSATILGRDSHAESLEIRRHVGYLPGDLALYPKLTGAQTLRYFSRLRGGVDETLVAGLAERLNADLTRRVGEYSTGNRQKIGLIQAFMHRPELMVLDEPTAGLDPLVQQEFHQMLAEVCAEGRTVFLSSHSLSEVEHVADRVGIIRNGRLVVVERVDELKRKAIRRIDFEFAADVPPDLFDGVRGVRSAEVHGRVAAVSFEGSVNALLQAAMSHEVLNLHSRESDLEEIFLAYYRDTQPLEDHPPQDGRLRGRRSRGGRADSSRAGADVG
ncbi:MAG: ABC transporter ATP-binding protein [Nocardioidaceae bacterium]